MSSKFGFRKTYHGSSDTVVKSAEPRANDGAYEEAFSSRLLSRRARLLRREIASLRIDTKLKPSLVTSGDVESQKSPDSPGSPDSPQTPSIPAPTVGSSPELSQGSTLGAAEGVQSPVSPASPASPPGAESPISTTASSFPPSTTQATATQTTTAISTTALPPPPPPPPPPSSTTVPISTALETSATSISTSLSSFSQTSVLSTQSTLLSSATSKVGVPTTLVPLITATVKKTTSTSSSSSLLSTGSTGSTQSAKITDGVTLEATISAPVVSTNPTTTASALSVVVPTEDATAIAQKGIKSDSGNLGVHVVFPVVFSVGVIAAFLAIFWFRRRRSKSLPTEDQAGLSSAAAPMGQQKITAQGDRQSLRFRSDGSVMADLMDAAYAAENGAQYRHTQLSVPEDYNLVSNEKMHGTADNAPVLSLPRRSGNTVFSWLGGLRSGAPTVRGSIAPPRSEATSANRTTMTGWPQGFEPADPQAASLPANTRCLSYWSESSQAVTSSVASPPPVPVIPSAMFEPRIAQPSSQSPSLESRPPQLPASPTQTAITYNTAAMTESSWNTWGVEQHPRGDNVTGKKELWGKMKKAMGGNR